MFTDIVLLCISGPVYLGFTEFCHPAACRVVLVVVPVFERAIRGALLLVSHNRSFLEAETETEWQIDSSGMVEM